MSNILFKSQKCPNLRSIYLQRIFYFPNTHSVRNVMYYDKNPLWKFWYDVAFWCSMNPLLLFLLWFHVYVSVYAYVGASYIFSPQRLFSVFLPWCLYSCICASEYDGEQTVVLVELIFLECVEDNLLQELINNNKKEL